MGQGTESCGGYDVDYDVYEDGLESGLWSCADGTQIAVSQMTTQHLRNARRVAFMNAQRSAFSSDAEKWESWVEIFEDELHRRMGLNNKEVKKASKPKQAPRGKMVTMICYCGKEYQAREADLRRGWGLTCCKSHAAVRREFGRPAAKRKEK